jgi:hypothetical protein
LRAGRSLANTDFYGQPDCDSHSNADAHTYSYGHVNSDCDCNRDTDYYCNGYANSDSYPKGNANSKTWANAEVASHSGTSPLASGNRAGQRLIYYWQWICLAAFLS